MEAAREAHDVSRLSIASPSLSSSLLLSFSPPIPHVANPRPVGVFSSSCNSFRFFHSFSSYHLYLFNLPLGFPWNAVFICFCVSPNFPTPLDPHSRPIWPTLRRLAMWPIPKRTGVVRYVEPECLECGLRSRLDADRVALSPVLLAFFEAREMLHQPNGFPTFVIGRSECHH